MSCPACLIAISGTDGLPSGGRSMGDSSPGLGLAPYQTAYNMLAIAGGVALGYLVLRIALPEAGSARRA